MSYFVGQIIYLLNTEKLKVYPVQVVEEITRKSLEGKQITYIVKLPDKEGTNVNLADINAKIFVDDKNLKSFMYENAKKNIDKLVSNANKVKEDLFSETENSVVEEKEEVPEKQLEEDVDYLEELKKPTNLSVQNGTKDDTIKVHLGNGINANVKINNINDTLGNQWEYFLLTRTI